ncbi:MAG: hypothetical protein N2323_04850 [candidate division WOR-3 bacterium]|nr:hypothetical protein [candidate division WOR-3 bacterium]
MKIFLFKLLFFCFFFFYFLFKKIYRKEIIGNYNFLTKNKKFPFSYYFLRLSENLSTMIVINKKNLSLIFDKISFLGDNIIKERGGVVITFHYGLYELLPLIFLRKGYKTAITYTPQKSKILNKIILKMRKQKTLKICENLKEIKKALLDKYLVGFAIDNVHKGKLFFLKELLPNLKVLKAPFIISQIFSYPLYFMLIRRNEKGYEVITKRGFSLSSVKEEIKKDIFDWVLWGK